MAKGPAAGPGGSTDATDAGLRCVQSRTLQSTTSSTAAGKETAGAGSAKGYIATSLGTKGGSSYVAERTSDISDIVEDGGARNRAALSMICKKKYKCQHKSGQITVPTEKNS